MDVDKFLAIIRIEISGKSPISIWNRGKLKPTASSSNGVPSSYRSQLRELSFALKRQGSELCAENVGRHRPEDREVCKCILMIEDKFELRREVDDVTVRVTCLTLNRHSTTSDERLNSLEQPAKQTDGQQSTSDCI